MTALGTWVDGIPTRLVPADDRGLQYGDGLFETMLVRAGRVRFLESHLARLAHGCGRLGIASDGSAVRADLAAALAVAPAEALLKLIVTRGSGPRGYAPRPGASRRIVTLHAAAPTDFAAGVALGVTEVRCAASPALAGLKHLNRLENVLAARDIAAGEFDVLMSDADGAPVSGSMCNLFVVHAGRIATPPVDRTGVAGVMRGLVLRECPVLGLGCEERLLTAADLARADEVFVTNARIGVVPVSRVGEHVFAMNSLALRLRKHIESLDA